MASSPPLGVPYDSVAAGKPPTYVTNIPMTALRQVEQGIDDEAMPYRPRDRPTEIAFRQLCCGTCWGLCAWIAGITILVTGTIITAIVLVTDSKHSIVSAVSVPSSGSLLQPGSLITTTLSRLSLSPSTSYVTIAISPQLPSISISITTYTPPQPSTITSTVSSQSTTTLTQSSTMTISSPSTATESMTVTETELSTTSLTQIAAAASTSSKPTSNDLISTYSGSIPTSTSVIVVTASVTSKRTSLEQGINAPLTFATRETTSTSTDTVTDTSGMTIFRSTLVTVSPSIFVANPIICVGTKRLKNGNCVKTKTILSLTSDQPISVLTFDSSTYTFRQKREPGLTAIVVAPHESLNVASLTLWEPSAPIIAATTKSPGLRTASPSSNVPPSSTPQAAIGRKQLYQLFRPSD